MSMVKKYRIVYDFKTKEFGELSVKQNEIVTSDTVASNGWMYVRNESGEEGHVPFAYVKMIEGSASPPRGAAGSPQRTYSNANNTSSASAHQHQGGGGGGANAGQPMLFSTSSSAPPPSKINTAPYPNSSGPSSSSMRGTQQQSTYGGAPGNKLSVTGHHGGNGSSGGGGGGGVFEKEFAITEQHFEDLNRQRREAMERVENALNEITSTVAMCKDKNSTLSRKLRDLDGIIEKERKRWKDRIEEEKVFLTQKTNPSNMHGLFAAAGAPFVSSVLQSHQQQQHHTTTTTQFSHGGAPGSAYKNQFPTPRH